MPAVFDFCVADVSPELKNQRAERQGKIKGRLRQIRTPDAQTLGPINSRFKYTPAEKDDSGIAEWLRLRTGGEVPTGCCIPTDAVILIDSNEMILRKQTFKERGR